MEKENNKKHLYWVVGLVLITIILCGTLIWINHNSWTIRFEMDDNTKEAIESIEWGNWWTTPKDNFSVVGDWDTNISLNNSQKWKRTTEYYCDDIHNDGLDLGDCILNKCFQEDSA